MRIEVMAEICQIVLDGFWMPVILLGIGIVVSIFNGMGNDICCSCYGDMGMLEHGRKVVEMVL